MEEDCNEVVAEHHHKFDNLPVCICVLETRSGFFAVGFSSTSPNRFDHDIAAAMARARATQQLKHSIGKWNARDALNGR